MPGYQNSTPGSTAERSLEAENQQDSGVRYGCASSARIMVAGAPVGTNARVHFRPIAPDYARFRLIACTGKEHLACRETSRLSVNGR